MHGAVRHKGVVMAFLEEDLINLSAYIQENNLADESFFVTGGTGYIGSLIVRALQKANAKKIYVSVRDIEKAKLIYDSFDGLSFVSQDLTEKIQVDGSVDYIIHTASPTTSKFFIEKPVETINSIVSGTRNVLDLAREKQAKSTVFLSSMEVFGSVDSNDPRSEDQLGYIDIGSVRSSYSESKRLAELMCLSYAKEYGLNVVIARLSQVFGAGVFAWDNRVFKQFAVSALKGENIVLHTKGDSYGNYAYSADAVKAIFTIMAKGESGQAYTVVNEENTMTIKEMAELVAENFSDGRSKVVIEIPKDDPGYAPKTVLRLSATKIRSLGWNAEYNLKAMYQRMMESLEN